MNTQTLNVTEQIEQYVKRFRTNIDYHLSQQSILDRKAFSASFAEFTTSVYELNPSWMEYHIKSALQQLCGALVLHYPALSIHDQNNRYSLSNAVSYTILSSLEFFRSKIKDREQFYQDIKAIVTSPYPLKNEIVYEGEQLIAFNKLCEATRKGNPSRIKYLIEEYDLDVNAHNSKALISAIGYNKLRSVELLINLGADISSYYFTPLMTSLFKSKNDSSYKTISDFLIQYLTYSDKNIVFDMEELKSSHGHNSKIFDGLQTIEKYKVLNNNLYNKEEKPTPRKKI